MMMAGDKLTIMLPDETPSSYLIPSRNPIEILYEDDAVRSMYRLTDQHLNNKVHVLSNYRADVLLTECYEILYEDDYLIIVSKPNYLNSTPSREHPHDSLIERVLYLNV
jgi:23S rRNA pseudouridine1911/1915/1917 synthase